MFKLKIKLTAVLYSHTSFACCDRIGDGFLPIPVSFK